jgi:hypothetical protein
MATITFSDESLLMDTLRSMIISDPSYLNNIIEPVINGLISDIDVPQIIKDKINSNHGYNLSVEQFNELLKEYIAETFETEFDEEHLDGVMMRYIESDVTFDRCLKNRIDNTDIGEAVVQYITDNNDPGNSIESSITNAIQDQFHYNDPDFSRIVGESIEAAIQTPETQNKINNIIKDAVDNRIADLSETAINNAITAAINAKLNMVNYTDKINDTINKKIDALISNSNQINHEIVASITPECSCEHKTQTLKDPDDLVSHIIQYRRSDSEKIMWILNLINKEYYR